MRVGLVSTYPPTKCGIAEYAYELTTMLSLRGIEVGVLAVRDRVNKSMIYPERVEFIIDRNCARSYREAANYVNNSGASLIHIQHEYGIFGGKFGEYILNFMERVSLPTITTLHTVLPKPERDIKEITKAIVELSDAITVMSHGAFKILIKDYNVSSNKIYVVPHGVKVPAFGIRRNTLKSKLGLSTYFIILTIGLLGPNKGVEYGIIAMSEILRYIKNALYLIVGETHPKIKEVQGDSYRVKLINLAKKLGVAHRVYFINSFLTKENYIKFILASDIVLLPYLDGKQVSSGALSYALGCGRVVVSTPFIYAKELLSEGRGIFCRFKDPSSIANAIVKVAEDYELRSKIESNALKCGVNLYWDRVISRLISVFTNFKDNEEVKAKSLTPLK